MHQAKIIRFINKLAIISTTQFGEAPTNTVMVRPEDKSVCHLCWWKESVKN